MANLPQIRRGDTYRFTYTHMHNGVAEDLTGCTVAFTVKDVEGDDSTDDSTAVIRKVVTSHSEQSGDTLGQTVIHITPSETLNKADGSGLLEKKTYYFSIKVKHADATQFTEEEGKVKVDTAPTNAVL